MSSASPVTCRVHYLWLWGRKSCPDSVITGALSPNYLKYPFLFKEEKKKNDIWQVSIYFSISTKQTRLPMVWNILTGRINSGVSLMTRCRRPKWHTPRARLTEGTDVSKFCQQTSCLTAGWKGNHRSEKIKKNFLSLGLVSLLQEWNRTHKRDWFVVLRVKWLHRGFFFFLPLGQHLSAWLFWKTRYCTTTAGTLNLT